MFFTAPQFIFYIKRNEIAIFSKKGQIGSIPLPEAIVNHLEVIDKEAYEKLLKDSFPALNIQKKTAVILLSDQLVFSLQPQGADEKEKARQIQEFIESIPFAQNKISAIHYKKEQLILATNSELYELLHDAAAFFHIKIKSVIPVTIVREIPSGHDFTPEFFRKVMNTLYLLNGNFLTEHNRVEKAQKPLEEEKEPLQQDIPKKPTMKKQYIMLLCSLLLVASVLIYAGISYGFIPNPFPQAQQEKATQSSIPVTPAQESESASPTPASFLQRGELTILVLNGSGVAGQASQIETKLREKGFDNIETGNASGAAETDTIVEFSSKVSEEDRKEITDTLNEFVSSISVQANSAEAKDIQITTGKPKEK